MCQADAVCNGQLRAQMGNHAHHMVFDAAKMEGSVSALGKSQLFALKLCK